MECAYLLQQHDSSLVLRKDRLQVPSEVVRVQVDLKQKRTPYTVSLEATWYENVSKGATTKPSA